MSPSSADSSVFEPTWESLQQYAVPEWYQDAKFGIFIHWGVYAVPAYDNEWYPRNMYLKGSAAYEHHRQCYGDQSHFGYKDFVPQLTAEQWNPERWADLFARSGAKYVVPVGEHHDGFPMYDCSYTDWNAAKIGPRRDIVSELERAVRQRGLKFGVSSHRAFNWSYYTFDPEFDTADSRFAGLYGTPHAPTPLISDRPRELRQTVPQTFLDDWLARTNEIVDKFHPDLLWFDFCFEGPEFEPYRKQFAAYYYNRAREWGTGVVINYKHEAYPAGVAVLDLERGRLDRIREPIWQTDTSVGRKSWCYIEGEQYKPVTELVHELVDIVSKNGCLLLNIGPRPDGTIPAEQEQILLGIGEWLGVNGAAIYGARHWRIDGEGPTPFKTGEFTDRESQIFTAQDVRFTTRDGDLYAICLGWPEEAWTIHALSAASELCPAPIVGVELLGSHEQLVWSRDQDGLTIQAPAVKPCEHAYAFKITLG